MRATLRPETPRVASRATAPRRLLALSTLIVAAAATSSGPLAAQDTRETVRALEARFPALRFNPPTPREARLSNGVQVFLQEDHTVPTLSVRVVGRLGTSNLPDSLWAAAWQADGLLRTGGTTTLTPDSVDKLIEFYALNVGFSTGQENSSASASGLSRYRDVMLDLLFDMMRNPRNDTSRIRETVGQVEESWRRRNDQPASILGRAWSQVILGDHPFARSLVTPEEAHAFTPERLRYVQGLLFCPDRFIIGVVGDFDQRAILAKLESLFRGWGRCPPGTRETPPVRYAEGPRIVLIERDINQTNLRMGHTGGLRVANAPDYFASQVADFLLGGGGGFNSRLLQRVRSDSGFAYSVFSNWGAETRREGQFFAGAQTRADKTVAALSLMWNVIGSMVAQPVTAEDVQLAKDNEINSFVFGFENASQIVGRQISYRIDGLPPTWFNIYLQGIQAVTPEQVRQVSERYLHPDRMITVVVGKPSAFDAPLSTLGPVTTMTLEEIHR
ncbi:MAG: insulinase family protein [Gemmatimonadetes bacterium]|nr:insulinase family protein [Gemmatimonadota bacterium]